MYCNDCGHVGKTKRHMPGSILIEIILLGFVHCSGTIIHSLETYRFTTIMSNLRKFKPHSRE